MLNGMVDEEICDGIRDHFANPIYRNCSRFVIPLTMSRIGLAGWRERNDWRHAY